MAIFSRLTIKYPTKISEYYNYIHVLLNCANRVSSNVLEEEKLTKLPLVRSCCYEIYSKCRLTDFTLELNDND